jgi:hypothetical protein
MDVSHCCHLSANSHTESTAFQHRGIAAVHTGTKGDEPLRLSTPSSDTSEYTCLYKGVSDAIRAPSVRPCSTIESSAAERVLSTLH